MCFFAEHFTLMALATIVILGVLHWERANHGCPWETRNNRKDDPHQLFSLSKAPCATETKLKLSSESKQHSTSI